MTIRDLAELIVRFQYDHTDFTDRTDFLNELVDIQETKLRKCYISDGNHLSVAVRVDDTIL